MKVITSSVSFQRAPYRTPCRTCDWADLQVLGDLGHGLVAAPVACESARPRRLRPLCGVGRVRLRGRWGDDSSHVMRGKAWRQLLPGPPWGATHAAAAAAGSHPPLYQCANMRQSYQHGPARRCEREATGLRVCKACEAIVANTAPSLLCRILFNNQQANTCGL